MTIYVKTLEGIAPANMQIDFRDIAAEAGPFWLSFDYWTHTPDVSAGAITGDINWVDPTSGARVKNGGGCDLTDAAGRNTENSVFMVQLEDGVVPFTFDMVLSGSAGSALISVRLVLQKDQAQVDW
jgi:hypothetical protein